MGKKFCTSLHICDTDEKMKNTLNNFFHTVKRNADIKIIISPSNLILIIYF